MKLIEVLSQIRTLTTTDRAVGRNESGAEQSPEKTADGSAITLSCFDRGSSQKKFEALKAYLDQTGKTSDPLLTQLVKFLRTELELITDSDSVDPSKTIQIHMLLSQLLEAPLAHETRLNALREKLSVNNQASWKPIEIVTEKESQAESRYEQLLESVGRGKKSKKYREKKLIPLPETVKNGNGKIIKALDKPNPSSIRTLKGEMVFEVPIDPKSHPGGIKAAKQKEALIDPEHHLIKNKVGRLLESDYLADYGVKWDQTKCIRDLLQNFLDSHGLTLEGVRIKVTRQNSNEPYVIRVEGLGEFHPEYVEKTGATTKKGSETSAGGFGEGAKILSLVFLRDHNVDKISFSSRNWRMEYTIDQFVSGKKGLFRKLDIVEDKPGNYVELVTDSAELVCDLINGVDLFYHPYNTDFSNPTFENEVGGFKYLGRDAGGNVYPVRQRYEVHVNSGTQWSGGHKQLSVWTNKRIGDWSPDRDRTAIGSDTIRSKMIHPLIESMSDEDLIKTIKLLEDFWTRSLAYYQEHPRRSDGLEFHSFSMFGGRSEIDPNTIGPASDMLGSLVHEAKKRNIITKFKDNLLTIPGNGSGFPAEYLSELRSLGYVFCMPSFDGIGMPKAVDIWKELAKHKPLIPTGNEIRQINTLKKAATILRQKFVKSQWSLSENDIAKPVYIFDRNERKVNKGALAEYTGNEIWFDRTFLGNITFERGLAAYLHELTHKYGGDETAVFSYKITDWLDLVMKSLNDPETKEKLDDLKNLWNEMITEDHAQASEDVEFLSGMIRSIHMPTTHYHGTPIDDVPIDSDVLSPIGDIGKLGKIFDAFFGKEKILKKAPNA